MRKFRYLYENKMEEETKKEKNEFLLFIGTLIGTTLIVLIFAIGFIRVFKLVLEVIDRNFVTEQELQTEYNFLSGDEYDKRCTNVESTKSSETYQVYPCKFENR